jgi:DNA helicase-2/ATP-dependent DNA helicase PcrA
VKKARGPSDYLEEIAQECREGHGVVRGWAAPPAEDEQNPTSLEAETAVWPHDPLGTRRATVSAAADLVRSYLDGRLPGARSEQAKRWRHEADLLLKERAEQARLATASEVPLPDHLSVSQLVALRKSPAELARSLRRPLPRRPDPIARRGTAFHTWLEQRFGADKLLDLDELPGAADADAAEDTQLAALQAAFLASAWAERSPVEVEVPFATDIGGVVIRGRMDAVFQDPDGGYDVVDWKTGRRPSGVDATAAAIQLAAYRIAWAALAGCPVERVRAAFHYVGENITVRPADLLDSAGLRALIGSLPET